MDRTLVVQAILAATTTLSGVIVVFQGFLLSAYAGFRPTDDPRVRRPFKVGIIAVIVLVILSVLVALGATAWLLGLDLYWIVVGGFILVLLYLVVVAVAVSILALR